MSPSKTTRRKRHARDTQTALLGTTGLIMLGMLGAAILAQIAFSLANKADKLEQEKPITHKTADGQNLPLKTDDFPAAATDACTRIYEITNLHTGKTTRLIYHVPDCHPAP